MIGLKEKAVIDADFFNKITNDGSNTSLFKAVMEELQYEPVMHRYVFDYELASNTVARTLVSEGYIIIEDENSFWATNETAYRRSFSTAYRQMNGRPYSCAVDVRRYHHQGENLGEIRSSLLAFFMGYHYFMTDDKGAKYYVTNTFSGRHAITVMNLKDTFEEIGKRSNRSIKWQDIKGMLKQNLNTKDFIKIRGIWVSE